MSSESVPKFIPIFIVKTSVMKKTIVTGATIVLLAACSSAQKTDREAVEKGGKNIPAAVRTAFAGEFPDANDVNWGKEGTNYEAEFENGETETSAVFDANGQLLEIEIEIDVASLPAAILGYIETNYKGQKIREAAKIVNADGSVNYEAEVSRKDLIFDVNGTYIKIVNE
jgi:hypothetical protein